MAPTSLAQRRHRLRLPLVRLAEAAGVDKYTVQRCLSGSSDTRSSKAAAIEGAVLSEELSLLSHLIRLHPDQARAALQAA